MPGYTARDFAISRDLRADEEAERVRREARVSAAMPRAIALARRLVEASIDVEGTREALDMIAAHGSAGVGTAGIAEDLIAMDDEEDDGATVEIGMSSALLYALWRLDVLAGEPESLAGDRVRWDGFGSVEAIRRALDALAA